MRPESTFGELVELPCLDISLELLVPCLRIKLRKPLPKSGKLRRGERPDLFL